MRGEVVTLLGGTGFIGRHVARRLADRGAVLRIPTRDPNAAIHLRPLGHPGQVVLIRADLRQDAALARLLDGANHVVNLVGILHESRKGDFARLQGELPGRVGRLAQAAGLRAFVQLSALGADPGAPSLYARTKAQGEAAALASFPRAVILRPSIVFGPEDSFFNRFAAMSRFAPALPLIGGGRTRFQPVYVGDVADAVVAGLTRPELAGKLFELGGPTVYSFADLLRYMLALLGRPRLLLNLPFGLATAQARVLEKLPSPPLTVDQVELLKRDNVVAVGAAGFGELGISPTPLETVVPRYLGAASGSVALLPVR